MKLRVRPLLPYVGLLALGAVGVIVGWQVGNARLSARTVPVGTPPSWTGRILDHTGARVLALDHLPATYALPDASGSVAYGGEGWTLDQVANRGDGVWQAPLPFRLPKSQARFAPEGMRVLVDGTEARFLTRADRGPLPWWQLADGGLEVSTDHPPAQVRVEYPHLAAVLDRLSWSRAAASGMSPEAFVRHDATLGGDSREGLLLPAPATATWADLTLPPGARFEAFVTLAPTPVERRSDGAEVVLAFLPDDGDEIELGRTSIAGAAATFEPWKLDLSAHAGEHGSLVIRTLPGPTGDGTDDFVFLAAPVVVGTPDGAVRRIVVIGVDTLRQDHLGMNGYPRATSPELDAWAEDAVIFDRAWTSAPRTRPSFRASTTGRLPLEAICAKNIGAVFDEAGFATAGIVANVHLNPRFDFHKGFDLWRLDSGAKVDHQVDEAIAWLDAHQDRDSYLFVHVMDPHVFYVAPPPFGDRFVAELPPLPDDEHLPYARLNRERVYRMMRAGRLSPLQQDHLRARYDGEIAYTSHELGRLLAHLDALPGDTTVVLHNDHGEELWDHGGYEHNHTLYDEVTRGVLVVKPPGGAGGRSLMPATLPDLAPTLYALAGLTDTPPTDGVSLVPALRGAPPDAERAIPIGYLQYEAERWGVVWHGHKYVLFTGTGQQELYDLQADPGEHDDLSTTEDTEPYWRKLAEVHHFTTGNGWRVAVTAPPGTSIDLHLPAVARQADVLDPESVTRRPVNQEWGEVPPVLTSDVGAVTLSDDGRTLHFVAGSHGEGLLWVIFDTATPAGGDALVDGATLQLGGGPVAQGAVKLDVQPGVIVVPPESEASRMMSCLDGVRPGEKGSESDTRLLQSLGYMQEEGAPTGHRGQRRHAPEGD